MLSTLVGVIRFLKSYEVKTANNLKRRQLEAFVWAKFYLFEIQTLNISCAFANFYYSYDWFLHYFVHS